MGQFRITKPEKQRPEWQKDAEAPPNTYSKRRTDKEDSTNDRAKQPDAEYNKSCHAGSLSTPSASGMLATGL